MIQVSIGISLGSPGAVAVLDYRTAPPTITVQDTPRCARTDSRDRRRREVDLNAILSLVQPYAKLRDVKTFIQHTSSRQDDAGAWEIILTGLGIPFERVMPRQWQRLLVVGQRQGDAARIIRRRIPIRSAAMYWFPSLANQLRATANHDWARALLAAVWGRERDLDLEATRRAFLPVIIRSVFEPSPILASLRPVAE